MAWPRIGPWIRRGFTAALLLLGIGLWVRHLRAVDWHGMAEVVEAMPQAAFIGALLLTIASYAVYAGFDLLARRVTGLRIDARRFWVIGLVSHACALNLGPAGVGFRLRLYTRHGIDAASAAALWIFNVATNWLGFVLLAGVALGTRSMQLPSSFGMLADASQGLGAALLAGVGAYLLACALAHGRHWTLFGRTLALPTVPQALLQCGLSVVNWCLLAGVLTLLLQHRAGFGAVLGALMASALALAVIDVPGGLGVTETVFLALLSPQVPATAVLAALLAYRAIYFLAPLLLALAAYVALEFDADAHRARRAARRSLLPSLSDPGRVPPARCLAPNPDALVPVPRRSSAGSTRSRP